MMENNQMNAEIRTEYFDLLERRISEILSRVDRDNLTYDILDTEKSRKNKLIALKEKQRIMKIGEIWQEVLGNYNGFVNLKVGHESGLDILSNSRKIIVELKNRTNTDNSSSKKSNLQKLAAFKEKNPEYTCIYANINEDTEEKTINGSMKILKMNECEILYLTGFKFLNFILGDDTNDIIEFVRNIIDKYT